MSASEHGLPTRLLMALHRPPALRTATERPIPAPRMPVESLLLTFEGQIRGGKNNMVVTRSGMHFPKKEWAKWRDAAVTKIRAQLPPGFVPFDQPMSDEIDYYAGDKRRRDRPAVLDAVWHVLEKAGVVTDDTLLRDSTGYRVHYDKVNPRLIIRLTLCTP